VKRPPSAGGELDRLLLRAALAPELPDLPARETWAELSEALAPPKALQRLEGERQALLGLLHRSAVSAQADDALAGIVRGGHRRTWAANSLRLDGLRRAAEQLTAACVEYLLADELAVVAILGDLGARPLERLRLVISPGARDRAASAMREAGWTPRTPAPGTFLTDPDATVWRAPGGQALELAWSLGRDLRLTEDEELRADSIPTEGGLLPGERRLADVHLLVRLAAAPAWAGAPRPSLLAVAELALVASRAGDQIWSALALEARRRGVLATAGARLRHLAQLVPEAVPAAWLSTLERSPAPPRERMTHQVALFSPALARYLRDTRAGPTGAPARRLASSLQESWGLETARDIPRAAVRHASARLREGLGGVSRAGGS